jgi:hypothetical protein
MNKKHGIRNNYRGIVFKEHGRSIFLAKVVLFHSIIFMLIPEKVVMTEAQNVKFPPFLEGGASCNSGHNRPSRGNYRGSARHRTPYRVLGRTVILPAAGAAAAAATAFPVAVLVVAAVLPVEVRVVPPSHFLPLLAPVGLLPAGGAAAVAAATAPAHAATLSAAAAPFH